jgi:ATP-dependent Clp protease ATP-binding subunit ClpA
MIERGLSKDTNHNVLLVGETGVGKSTLTQYLGRLGQSALSFHGIRNHRVVELRVEGISLEDFETSMEEARSAGNVVVVIENIHGYEILYERLAHYLNSKELGIIATTDFANFDQVLKSHPEFLVKFEKVEVDPTSAEDTLAILYNTASIYGTSIKKDVLLEIVELSERMIHNQPQPLKSLLLLEELRSLGKKITIDDVRSVVSDKTNMPIGLIGKEEREILLDLEKNMREKIVGQDEAVKDVTEALKRLRTGIADPSKPAGTFLFLGPTGVGKTYTAKILAESYFGRRDAMVRFDMSEFSQEESLSLFSDRLASVMEENPLSLVFFDELEKSHRSIQHLLLQVLDEGKLTRENGRVATFTDSIIIATSNAGSKNIVGDPMIDKKTLIYFLIHDGIFAPEFLNRFSSIVLFKPLSASQVKIVAELMLNEFTERLLEEKGIKVVITPALIEKIAEAGFDPEFGARPIKRAIEEIVENKVAEYILAGKGAGEFKIL